MGKRLEGSDDFLGEPRVHFILLVCVRCSCTDYDVVFLGWCGLRGVVESK